MSDGMVALGARPRHAIDFRYYRVAGNQAAAAQHACVPKYVRLNLLRIRHRKSPSGRKQLPAVAYLAPGFRIERRMIQHHDRLIARFDKIHAASFPVESKNPAFVPETFITVEL